MKKRIFALFASVLIFVFCAVPCFAKYDGKAVYDLADVLSDTEEAMIEEKAKECFGKSYAKVYIVTHKDSSGAVTYWGENFKKDYGISGACIVLIITDNGRDNYDIYTYGKCGFKVSDSEVDDILDSSSVFNNIKAGKYADGAIGFIEQSAGACKTNVKGVLLLAFIPSLIIAIIVFFCVKNSYAKKSRSDKYPLDQYAKLSLRLSRDDFMGSFVTKRYISSSSSGGGGGHSGGGGGGGHRGGR